MARRDSIMTKPKDTRGALRRMLTFLGPFRWLILLVAIPLPGTGAWTGTLAASLLDIGFKKSVLAVTLGVLLAGIIMGTVSAGAFGALGTIFS